MAHSTPGIAPHRTGPWIMHMRWTQLLFMHWPIRPVVMRALIPAALEMDTFDNQAWLGIVPFRMSNVRPRCVPPMGRASAFPELNVRTYVKHRGRTGVWFFSLDAASKLAVRGARLAFHLPYFDAKMSVVGQSGAVVSPSNSLVRQSHDRPVRQAHDRADHQICYDSIRTHRNAPPARLHLRYGPTGPAVHARPGSLDDFLTNRLCLFSVDRQGQLWRGDIDHVPWPLQPAEAEIKLNEMTGQIGVLLPDVPPLLHYAERLDVVAWPVRRV